METNEIGEEKVDMDLPIGTKEVTRLKEGTIKIESAIIDEVKNKEGKIVGKKVVCLCKHPDKEELISISSAKHIVGKNIKSAGLWFNKDEDGLISKNSALAHLLVKVEAKTISELSDKIVQTEKDENDYLCFKAY